MSQPSHVIDASEEVQRLRHQGNQLCLLRQPQSALQCFERALQLQPDDALTLIDYGDTLQDLHRFDAAIESYDRALCSNPGSAATLVNRSNALRALKRFDEAMHDVEAALKIRPAFAYALNSRGNLLRDLGRLDDAVAAFDQAVLLKPDFDVAHCNRGKALLDLQRAREALTSFEAALQFAPDDGEALFGRASALLQLQQRLQQADADFTRAAERGIERTEVLAGRAAALAQLNRHAEAAACLSQLLQLSPDWEYAPGNLLHSRLQSGDWSELAAQFNELSRRVGMGLRASQPHSLLSVVDSVQLHLTCARVFAAQRYPAQALGQGEQSAVVSRATGAGGKIRVAYISADFCEHPVSYLLTGVLERHDRESFEVIGVSLQQASGSELRARVSAACDRFIEVGERSDREVAQLLRELGVDIAVDLMGFTQGLRLGIFAHRAAPVQVNYLGYAGTLGAPYMDYVLADEVVIPAGEERWYAEQVVRLPHCYLPNDDRREIAAVRPTRAQARLPQRGLVFCAFTNTYKINPPVYDIWMRLLREVSGSVLWLRGVGEPARGNLRREAQRRGVQAERLVFAEHVGSMAEHLARQGLADLYLDTLPYNAHSTACDALWAGVPVLTCAGRSFAGRVAASALTALGLPELITHSLEEYEHRALQLAREPQRLGELRERLAAHRLTQPLFDTKAYTRALESAYRTMHQRAVRAQAPQGFTLHTESAA
jgi:protein O-GlcNAc transferase